MKPLAGILRLRLLLVMALGCSLCAAPLEARTRTRSRSSRSASSQVKSTKKTSKKESGESRATSAPSRHRSSGDNEPAGFEGWAASTASAERNLGENWTVIIQDLATTETIFEYNSTRRLAPASNRKIITFGMALENLGPDYQFQTEFGLSAPCDPGRSHFHGDVILRSNGDPSLTDPFMKSGKNPAEIFRTWVDTLKASGIKTIQGNVVVDASAFGDTQNRYPEETWGPNHKNQTYAPIPSALAMCQNLMRITVAPSRAGSPCRVSIFPADEGITVINNTRTGGRGRGVNAVFDEDSKSLQLSGSVSSGGLEVATVPIPHPLHYVGQLLRNTITENGISVTGRLDIRTSVSQPGAGPAIVQRMGTHESPPLVQMLFLMMRESNNFLAEQLWRAAAARAMGCGDVTRARQAEIDWYKRHGLTGIEPGWDGSGLSRMDQFCARDMAAIVRALYNTAYQTVFLEVLPTAGESGTMRHRTTSTMDGRVTAKTGTLSGASSLSGFIKDSHGRPRFVFSAIGNARRDTNGRLAMRINSLMNIAINKLDADIAAGRRPALGPPPPPGPDYDLRKSTLYAGSADFVGTEAERMGAEQELPVASAAGTTSTTATASATVESGVGQGR